MGLTYQAIHWNKTKKIYDKYIGLVLLFLVIPFIALQFLFYPDITIETLIIRSTAFVAIVLLHIILMIGPLTRLDDRFYPLLYNRRHLGVAMFLFALVHGVFSIVQFHALGNRNPIVSVFTSNEHYLAISAFPFQVLGFLALVILMLMAVSSHDFWLRQLSAKFWKGLHMMVYIAYFLIFAHVALGTLQYEDHPMYWLLLIMGAAMICTLHLLAGWKAVHAQAKKDELPEQNFYKACHVNDIESDFAKTCIIQDQNIAIFKYDQKISAVSNICKHQMGPLGEGKIIDGCITCPWHGYQYLPHNGESPPPFNEQIATYMVKVVGDEIWVNPQPNPEGTAVEPASVTNSKNDE